MERKVLDRLLPLLLTGLLLIGGLLLHRRLQVLRDREKELAGLALARSQELLQVRLGAMFNEWEEDLLEEAEAVQARLEEDAMLQRWNVVLHNHWEILSVRLADERGNETAIYREDTSLLVIRTLHGSKGGDPMASPLGVPADSMAQPWPALAGYDPRERIWFSKALENSRETPIWTLRQIGDTTEKVIQVSILAKPATKDDAFQVIIFDVSLNRAKALDQPSSSQLGIALLTSDGGSLLAMRTRHGAGVDSAMSIAMERWSKLKTERVLRFGGFVASFEPYGLNGLNLTTGILLDAAPVEGWILPERRLWAIAVAWFAMLCLALVAMLLRGRQRYKEQARLSLQNRQLDHRLAKALGERDVLSREVHHRVKNNLQVVSSLLNLQASSLADGAVRAEFLRGKRRIDTIALVHHRLYDHPDLRDIELHGFLSQLTASIAAMHDARRGTVSIGVATDGLRCDQDTAIELGIIVCELVTNAFQHAFPHATGGHVDVQVTHVEGDLHRLVVSNNGVVADKSTLSGPGKLGLEIVEALAEQLDGSLHVRTEGLPAFEVLFRMKRPWSGGAADA